VSFQTRRKKIDGMRPRRSKKRMKQREKRKLQRRRPMLRSKGRGRRGRRRL